jgi:hypothetical protein
LSLAEASERVEARRAAPENFMGDTEVISVMAAG